MTTWSTAKCKSDLPSTIASTIASAHQNTHALHNKFNTQGDTIWPGIVLEFWEDGVP